jgi:hypothetical protein
MTFMPRPYRNTQRPPMVRMQLLRCQGVNTTHVYARTPLASGAHSAGYGQAVEPVGAGYEPSATG